MSDFNLYLRKKILYIPLLVLCIPILRGPALQCMHNVQHAPLNNTVSFSKVKALPISTFFMEVRTRSNLHFKKTVIEEH